MTSNSLVQVLEGMKLEDGTPDINLRTSAYVKDFYYYLATLRG